MPLEDVRPDDDFDGDGISRRDEFLADTNPADTASREWIGIVAIQLQAGSRAAVELIAVPGETDREH